MKRRKTHKCSIFKRIQNVDIKGMTKRTPLHYACLYVYIHLPIVEYLIPKGVNVNAVDVNGETSLHLASNYDKNDISKCLVST